MICWYDLETTGTDEHRDSILEIGYVLTDDSAETVVREQQLVVYHGSATEVLREFANPVVQEMHDVNGLWLECADESLEPLRSLSQVETYVLEDLERHLGFLGEDKIVGAGSGVAHFDRRFLQAQMYQLHKRLAHWSLDVGVVRRFMDMTGVPRMERSNPEGREHRALDDALGALEQWRYYQRVVRAS